MNEFLSKKITARMLPRFSVGQLPWEVSCSPAEAPINLVTGEVYPGLLNILLTRLAGFKSPIWVEYEQAEKLALENARRWGVGIEEFQEGGRKRWRDEKTKALISGVRAGERCTYAILPRDDDQGERTQVLFNVEQCEGIGGIPELEDVDSDADPIHRADRLMLQRKKGATIRSTDIGRPRYRFWTDEILLPERESFRCEAHYYRCMFHLLGHYVGIRIMPCRRLNSMPLQICRHGRSA